MQKITINGKIVSFWTNNSQSTSTILILHGFRGSHQGLIELARTLPDLRVIMLDLPGYGESEPLETVHDFQSYAQFLDTFCQALGLQQCIVLGHSYGASLAIVFSTLFPQRVTKLVLITPVTSANTIEAKLGKLYYRIALLLPLFIRRPWLKNHLIDYLTDIILLKTAGAQKRHELIMANQQSLAQLNDQVVLENFLGFYSSDVYAMAPAILSPTFIICGEADHISPPESMRKLHTKIQGSRLQMIPRAGHLVPLEQPSVVGRLVGDFIQKAL
jgi:pimeloyl-ACP methyl ester carboxylesterase